MNENSIQTRFPTLHRDFKTYLQYLESLSVETLNQLPQYTTESIIFSDPFNELHGRDKMKALFEKMFRVLGDLKFIIKESAEHEDTLFVSWDFQYSLWLIQGGKIQSIPGVSQIKKDEAGKITEHRDFWDSGEFVFGRVPVVGWFVRLLQGFV